MQDYSASVKRLYAVENYIKFVQIKDLFTCKAPVSPLSTATSKCVHGCTSNADYYIDCSLDLLKLYLKT